MKVSVIIANYNGEMFIDECIKSLKNQKYNNFEIIFFDDCSTDNSINVIKKFKDIKIIKNKSHTSIGSYNQINAYKKAFELSKGEIIFTLDSDDFFHPNKIERVLKYYESNVKMAFDLPIILQNNKTKIKKNKSKNFRISFFPFITQQSCLSIRREFFLDLIERINLKNFNDVWFDFRAAIYAKYKFGQVFIIDEHLTNYRITNNNASYKFNYLSKLWWKRRLDYHNFTQSYCDLNNHKYYYSFDLLITKFVNYLIK